MERNRGAGEARINGSFGMPPVSRMRLRSNVEKFLAYSRLRISECCHFIQMDSCASLACRLILGIGRFWLPARWPPYITAI